MTRIILASKSARRQELLKKITADFDIEVADIDESMDPEKGLRDEIERVARRKAESVAEKHPDSLVIGSDTIVVMDDEVLLKPKDRDDARTILKKLSGRTHYVYTAVAIIKDGIADSFVETASVEFNELTDAEIEAYISTDEPYDKAGAYGIQGQAALFVKGIKGDYYSIMGLPVSRLYQHLKKYL